MKPQFRPVDFGSRVARTLRLDIKTKLPATQCSRKKKNYRAIEARFEIRPAYNWRVIQEHICDV